MRLVECDDKNCNLKMCTENFWRRNMWSHLVTLDDDNHLLNGRQYRQKTDVNRRTKQTKLWWYNMIESISTERIKTKCIYFVNYKLVFAIEEDVNGVQNIWTSREEK